MAVYKHVKTQAVYVQLVAEQHKPDTWMHLQNIWTKEYTNNLNILYLYLIFILDKWLKNLLLGQFTHPQVLLILQRPHSNTWLFFTLT